MIYTEEVKNRIFAILGAPAKGIELDNVQMQELWNNAVKNWNFYSNFSKMRRKKKEIIKNDWIENYFQALCKEALSHVRGKFNGELPIPGAKLRLNYKFLFNDAKESQKFLIDLLI